MKSLKSEKEYYRRLDIIRIISCIMVLLYHLNLLKGGFLAVCTFFTLSGYLSCMSAMKQKSFSVKKYYLNRIKKIYIPLLVVTFITVILAKMIPSINWVNLKQETTSVALGYNNYWQLGANLDYFTRHNDSPFMHFWYIAILMQFDIVFQIAVMLFRKIDKKFNGFSTIMVILLTIASTGLFFYMSKTQDIMMVYYSTFARSFSIMFGVFLALIQFKYGIKLSSAFKSIDKVIFTIYTAIFIALTFVVSADSSHYALFMILTSFITCRLIEYSTMTKSKKDDSDKLVKTLAKASYEIYLVQYPVIFFVNNTPIPELLKIPAIICITLSVSYILNFLLTSKGKIMTALKVVLVGGVIAYGGFIVVMEKDNTAEIKELEEKLNQNAKIIEERNNEYMNALSEEEEKWNELLASMDDEETAVAELVKNLPIVGVGDSVLLGVSDELYERFPNGYFDGKVSRSITGGQEVLEGLINEGKLGNTVLLALANNGDYTEWKNEQLMELLGDREVYWVDAMGADDPKFNERFAEFAKKYPNLHVIEWEKIAKAHPEYIYADGVHVKGDGIAAYADNVYNAIYNTYLEQFRQKKAKMIEEHESGQKNKISFYGNAVLTNSYSFLNETFDKAIFNAKSTYDANSLYSDIESKVNNNALENRIVLLLDKEANMSKSDYQKIINLCSDIKLYICNMTGKDFNFSGNNVKVIDFYSETQSHPEYLMADKKHLTDAGNRVLADMIKSAIGDN